ALLPEARGKGYGTQAHRALARYLFAHTTAHRIEGITEAENLGEQRVLEKAGFTREGVMRGVFWRDGADRDGVLYSLLRTDPPGRPTGAGMRARPGGSAEQVLTLLPGKPEQRSTRGLKRLAAIGEPGNGLGGERDTRRTAAGDDPALGVPRDQAPGPPVPPGRGGDRDRRAGRGETQRGHHQAR